jgi:hypothetical protein
LPDTTPTYPYRADNQGSTLPASHGPRRNNRPLASDGHASELRDLERAVASGTREAGRGLKSELRRQVASAGLGQRLANSWRDKHYPNHKLDAASLVYSKAP